MLPTSRHLAAILFLFGSLVLSVSIRAQSTVYPFFKEIQGEGPRAARAAELEASLSLAGSASKINDASQIAQGYLYQNPKTAPWDKAMQAAEYLDLVGNAYGAYFIALLVKADEAPYPDFALHRQLLERSSASSDKWLISNASGLLGDVYRHSYGVPHDYAKAAEHYQRAVESGNSNASNALGFLFANGYLGEPNFGQALIWYRKAKELGNKVETLESTISALESGSFVPSLPSARSAAEFNLALWHSKADGGDALAAFELAILYGRGIGGVYYSNKVADYWRARASLDGFTLDLEELRQGTEAAWKSLADQGSPLGKALYAYNVGFADAAKRSEFLRLCDDAIQAGYVRGYYRKAFAFYDNGEMPQALSLLEEASARGFYIADAELSSLFFNGTKVDRDYEKAVKYARRSPLHAVSQNILGLCYLDGLGVEKDQPRAITFFNKSMELGADAYPLYNLARCYANGWGVEKDLERARELALDSREDGHPSAAKLVSDIDAGVYTPRTPPGIGTVYVATSRYGSQLPDYGDFELDKVTDLYRIFDYKGKAYAHARVQAGPHYFNVLINCSDPALSRAEWHLVSVLPEMTVGSIELSGEVFLARIAGAGGPSDKLCRSVGGGAWEEVVAPAKIYSIGATNRGFIGVAGDNSIYVSQDGSSWKLGTDGLKLGSYFAPFNASSITVSGGWVFVTPAFGYSGKPTDTAPVIMSEDGVNWKQVATVSKEDALTTPVPLLCVSSEYAVLELDNGGDTNTRRIVFRGGVLESDSRIKSTETFTQLIGVGGHLFALGEATEGTPFSYFQHSGFTSAAAKERPERAAPAFLRLDRLYAGEPLPQKMLPATLVGRNLLVPNAVLTRRYFLIGGFKGLSDSAGDFAAIAGSALEALSDHPQVKIARQDEDVRKRIAALQAKADAGDAAAGAELGRGLLYGNDDILKNEYLGMSYLESAASKDDMQANTTLAVYWIYKDVEKGKAYFDAAIAGGNDELRSQYAMHLDTGRMNPQGKRQIDEAIAILQPLAAKGKESAKAWIEYLGYEKRVLSGYDAEAYLGMLKLRKSGVELPYWSGTISELQARLALAENGEESIIEGFFEESRASSNEAGMKKWLAKLVELKNPVGLYYDALASYQGSLGYAKDEAAGLAKMQQAADAGSLLAMKEVANFYSRGLNGYAKDWSKAKEWVLKVKAGGEIEWADAYIKTYETELAGNADQRPLDGKVSGLSGKVLEQLTNIQNTDAIVNYSKDRVGYLFAAIWWDAEFSKDEEDLVRELQRGLALEITSDDGTVITFTKSPPAEDQATWQTVFPDPFPLGDTNYPLASWNYAATPGPTVYFLRNPATRDSVRQILGQALYGDLSNRVQQAEQSRNVGYVTEFVTMLLSRAKAGDAKSGREFATALYSIVKDDIKANPNLLAYFSSLQAFANSPMQP